MKTINNIKKFSGDMNCIWMTSELVSYKLCDKEFDCENCEFDKVIRNLSIKMTQDDYPVNREDEDPAQKLIKRIENTSYNEKYIYLRNQLVMKNFFGDVYYLGINPVILSMLDDVNFIHEFNCKEVKKDQIIFTLEGQWGMKKFISPVDFMLIEKINFSHFKLNQWYSIVLFNDAEKERYSLTEQEWNDKKSIALSYLKEFALKRPYVGQTLNDGGEKIKFLHQYFGSENYLGLLNSIFV